MIRLIRTPLIGAALLALYACSSDPPMDPMITPDAGIEIPDAGPQTPESQAAHGMAMYRSLRCANCHGADARGGSSFPGGPLIVGRNAEDILRAVVRPCDDPNSLTNCHPLKIPDLADDVIQDLVVYLLVLAQGGNSADPGPSCNSEPGRICTIAGNGIAGSRPGDNVFAREAYLFWPQNVTLDAQGRVIITDWNNYIIRRIEKDGCVDAPGPNGGPSGQDCPMTKLIGTGVLGDDCNSPTTPFTGKTGAINHPVGVHFDHRGNMVMWGWHQWKVKYLPVDANGEVGEMLCMWGGGPGLSGDGQPAGSTQKKAKFDLPGSAFEDVDGSWYIADQGNLRIRRIIPDADDNYTNATDFVGTLQNNIVETWGGGLLDGAGFSRRTLSDYSDSGDGGPVNRATFNVETGFEALPQMRMVLDRDRRKLYVADSQNDRIRVIDLSTATGTASPIIDTIAGGGTDVVGDGVPARNLKLHRPADVDLVQDGSGDLLISDTDNNCIRRVDILTGLARTVAGICGEEGFGYAGDGGPGLSAKLAGPGGAWMAADGTLYIADTLNHRIRRMNP